MDLTAMPFVKNQNRMDENEDTQKMPVIQPSYPARNRNTDALRNDLSLDIEESARLKGTSVTSSKDAPGEREQPQSDTRTGEHGALAVQNQSATTIARPEKTPLADDVLPPTPFRSPATPGKQLIPARRVLFEEVARTPRIARKSAFNPSNSPEATNKEAHAANLLRQKSRLYDEAQIETHVLPAIYIDQRQLTTSSVEMTADIETQVVRAVQERASVADFPTTPLPTTLPVPSDPRQKSQLTRTRAVLLALLLLIVVINATVTGFGRAFGPQGWASIFGAGHTGPSLLKQVGQQFGAQGLTPGTSGQVTPTPEQLINALMAHMTLDQKIGQMLMVRFSGFNDSPDLNAMLTQYHVGSVIEYASNIGDKAQLISLNTQIQQHADLPMIISIDQEGGTVDRLQGLDGPQPSAATIGATDNPNAAYQQGIKDAQDLASYGFNLNLAPVIDVTNVYNAQLAGRTYGNNPTIVSKMAEAYLKGLQESGKVLGTIKHFPGLGDTSTDPHTGLPYLTRSLASLDTVDWAPYKNLLEQHNVYAALVTHEMVKALDSSLPSSLSPKIVGILREQLGFQGVIITDGLTMGALTSRYTLGQSAVLAIEAGDDLLMDPASPNEVAQMVNAIRQALSSGAISQQRIDDSVRRVLLLKYQMGLLNIHS